MEEAIVVDGLRKTYRTKKRRGLLGGETVVVEALRGVSFSVRRGEVVGLLGPNGAGKTTTIKIIATLLLPDDGDAFVMGHSVVREPWRVRENIGLMLTVEKGFYGKLTGRENLEYFAALYGLPRGVAEKRVAELLSLLELDKLGAADRLFEEYSLGMKARLGLARALLRDPPVLLLDEPTLGLDPPSARRIRELVKSLAHREGKAILYTTHNMFEAEIVCDRILLINKGRIVAEGSPEKLKEMIPYTRTIVVQARIPEKPVPEKLGVLGDASISPLGGGVYEIRVRAKRPREVLGELIHAVVGLGGDILDIRMEEPTLEDVFIYFSRGEGDGER